MAEIRNYPFIKHLRSDATSYVVLQRNDRVAREGRGLSFFFAPLWDGIAEIPVDDRELTFVVHGRSSDYQDVTFQAVFMWRAADPRLLASRVDFSIDTRTGQYRGKPLEAVNSLVSRLAVEHGIGYLARTPLRQVLADGSDAIRRELTGALARASELQAFGLELTSLRVVKIAPEAGIAQAIEAPARERIKQDADEAAFARRAMAVDKERAIAENELANRIELARREDLLIDQEGANAKKRASEEAATQEIVAQAQAHQLEVVEAARFALERERLDAYRTLPGGVLAVVAARDLGATLAPRLQK
jgi:regulator of protease activity HflC (stomatin/prohibitin superfamily)